MANEAVVLTPHLYFARRGDSIDSVTVGREAKPDVSPESNWTDLGICATFNVEDNGTTEDIMKGQPGVVSLYEVIKLTDGRTVTCDMVEFNALAVQALFNSGNITTTFVPGSAGRHLQGWLKVQLYNQDNELVIAMDIWADVQLTSANIGLGVRSGYTLAFRQLYSTLNTGNLSNL
jgi:hypothetical protein